MTIDPSDIVAIGVTNQRETTVVWDSVTGEPLYNAIGKYYIVLNILIQRLHIFPQKIISVRFHSCDNLSNLPILTMCCSMDGYENYFDCR